KPCGQVSGPRLVTAREVVVRPYPLGRDGIALAYAHLLVTVPVRRVGSRRCVGRDGAGRRPVVWSAESGSATRIPAISRPSPAVLTATRASFSAVAEPAEIPSTVAVVRITSPTCGAWSSTTATTTVSAAERGEPASSSSSFPTVTRR